MRFSPPHLSRRRKPADDPSLDQRAPSASACGWIVLGAFLLCLPSLARAQLLDTPAGDAETSSRYAPATPQRFRVGAIITAKNGACRDIRAMVAVPLTCENQTVRLIEEDFTSDVTQVKYRDLQGGAARQMLISIPFLKAGAEARALVTFEVTTHPILPPDDSVTAQLRIPPRTPRNLRRFLSPSPFIEAKNPKIKRLARDVLAELEESAQEGSYDPDEEGPYNDWRRVETLYDLVLDTIEYAEGPDTSAATTLRDGMADCHGRSALFIALCRTIRVPSRMVWVQDHCYPEFYMENSEGEGTWFPAESAGTRAFGEMPIARTILQKGDNFRVPERPRDRLRYASDYLTGRPVPGSGKPRVKYIREVVR